MASELAAYIQKARENKISDDQIKKTLLDTGWPQDKVDTAFSQPNTNLPVPPPPPPPPIPHVGMWTGFLYIIFFISLYILATATANILHVWIDNLSEAPERFGRYYDSGYLFLHSDGMVSGAIAAIIVSYPIFAWLAVYLKKQRDTKIFVRNLRSRKILIYITLVGTFLIMIGHVISTIYNFLSGSGTENTIGHLLVTLVVAGLIFWYFISEVKNDSKN